MDRRIADFATLFGAGHLRKAPGTFGALLSLPLGFLMHRFPLWAQVGTVCALVLFAMAVCKRYLRGAVHSDPSEVIIDEFAGMLVALCFVPFEWAWITAAFVLFRFFDIVKPGPIAWIDRKVAGAPGIVLDDVAAGLATGLVLLAARLLI